MRYQRQKTLPSPMWAAAWLALAGPLAAGCSMSELIADNMAGSLGDMQAAFNREESPKQAREAAPALLAMLDGFIVSSPDNVELLLAAAEMNATAAFAFYELEDERWARATYRKARRYGLAALQDEDAGLARVLEEGGEEDVRRALAGLERGDDRIPALFWSAFAWGGLINVSRDDMDAIAELPKVVAVMQRLTEVAPGFFHGGPHLFLAMYYSSRGRAVGGDPQKGREHFDEVFLLTRQRALLPHVLFAENYCVALGADEPARARALFTKALLYVREAPADIWPEQRLQNEIAKQWAEELLPELDDLIFPPLPDEE